MRIAVLITCFNRKEITHICLERLSSYSGPHNLSVTVVDGGSSDGTCEMIEKRFPSVELLKETNFYWAMGMRQAWLTALNQKNDFYLLLNDDLELYESAINMSLEDYDKIESPAIIVGKVKSKATGKIIYGGLQRFKKYTKLNFKLSEASDAKFETLNGNFVLVPSSIVNKIGIFSSRFTHSMADIEYGLRATSRGYKIFQTSSFVGDSEYNYRWHSESSRFSKKGYRYIFFHPKGLPIREWLFLCKTYGGRVWLFNFIYRYLKMLGK